MNTDLNLALVRQAWDCISRKDFTAFLTLLANDILWIIPEMPNVPFAGTWRGRAEVERFFRTVAEAQETLEFAPHEFVAQDDKVVVLGHFVNRTKATGKLSRSDWAQAWTVQDGKLVEMREYVDTLAVASAFSAASE